MRIHFWRSFLPGRSATRHLLGHMAVLLVMAGVLTTSLFFARPAVAAPLQNRTTTVPTLAQDGTTPRLEVFENFSGVIYHKWSDDNGLLWSSWQMLPQQVGLLFVGTPAVVSPNAGRLIVFARDTTNAIYFQIYNLGMWSGWGQFLAGGTALSVIGVPYTIVSDPALSSWGSGHLDLFFYGRDASGATWLLHNSGSTVGFALAMSRTFWVLGPGLTLQGNPAAVSWGPNRIDVFGWGPANELEHQWYDMSIDNSWHGWENKGGVLTSSPTVTSAGSGWLHILVRNTANGLSFLQFAHGFWSSWVNVDSNTMSSAPAAADTPNTINVFAVDPNGNLVYNYWTDPAWVGWRVLQTPQNSAPAAVAWQLM